MALLSSADKLSSFELRAITPEVSLPDDLGLPSAVFESSLLISDEPTTELSLAVDEGVALLISSWFCCLWESPFV